MMATTKTDDFTARMFDAINSMMLDMLAAVARKDYEDRRRRVASPASWGARIGDLPWWTAPEGERGGYRWVMPLSARAAVLPMGERVGADLPQVEDCYSVAGEANYILKVRTRTTGELEDLIRLLREKVGVATRTTIALSIPFEDRPIRT